MDRIMVKTDRVAVDANLDDVLDCLLQINTKGQIEELARPCSESANRSSGARGHVGAVAVASTKFGERIWSNAPAGAHAGAGPEDLQRAASVAG